MDVNSGIEVEASRNLPNLPDKPNFEQKANALIDKFGLREGIMNVDQVVAGANEFTRQHNVPETFTDDEINLALILGCSQKLIESPDPYYKSRVDNLARRLVSHSVAKGVLDEEELWGSSSDRGGLDDDKLKEYVASKTDPEATTQFIEKYKEEIERCKAAWKRHGYDELDVQVHIIADDPGQFQTQTRSQAYVNPPERDRLNDPTYKPIMELVLLKGHSAERDELVRHELYHIEDFFDFFRRGYQNGVFELLDELHTEYKVGNYTSDHSRDPFGAGDDGAYYSAKEFWDKLSFLGDLDFNLIADRQLALETIVQRFGFEGLVDFALTFAHSGGKIRTFETFYVNQERGVLAMLIDRDKMSLLKAHKSGTVSIDSDQIQKDVVSLADYMTPSDKSWSPRYRSLYGLIPTQFGQFYAARPFENGYTSQVDNKQTKQIINSYTQALAIADLSAQDISITSPEVYTSILGSIYKVPFHREEADYTTEGHLAKEREHNFKFYESEEEFMVEKVRALFQRLVADTPHVEIAFNLNNPDVRQSILDQFFGQLDELVGYAQQDPNDIQSFITGMYGFNLPFEIRESSVNYLSTNYPDLQPIFEKVRQVYDSRKLSNRG